MRGNSSPSKAIWSEHKIYGPVYASMGQLMKLLQSVLDPGLNLGWNEELPDGHAKCVHNLKVLCRVRAYELLNAAYVHICLILMFTLVLCI